MKKLLLSLLFAAAGAALAAVTLTPETMTDRGWQLKRGTSNVGTPHATLDGCRAALKADVAARKLSANYTCVNTRAGRGEWAADTPSPPPTSTGMMPAVNAALIPVGSAGSALELARATTEQPGPSDGTGAFRTVCDFSHMNFDDALVYPGQQGRSHLHAYFGNTGANFSSTVGTIANSGNSTCRGGILNRSAYWVPAMIDTLDGRPIKPRLAHIYYKTGYGGVVPSTVQPMPPGLRMIAGDMKNASPGGINDLTAFDYSCHSPTQTYGESRAIPNCAAGDEVWMHIYFPQCWDGKNLDSPDHKSHMAYPRGGCPASHPVALPEITMNVVYAVSQGDVPSRWRLSSDNYPSTQPGGYSAHGDWMNGWQPTAMDALTNGCNRPARDCSSHLLGDGRTIY